jgi:predicted O-methyltransferase YrrM
MYTGDFRFGTVSEEEYAFLRELVMEAGRYDGPIIEIGTLLGGTTSRLPLWARQGQKVITVDNFSWNPWGLTAEQHRSLASQVLYYLTQTGRVELVCQDKGRFYRTYNGGPPALVFLDADHDYKPTTADIRWALSVDARIISGHDYCDLWPGVVQAVEEHGGIVRRCGSVWVLRQERRALSRFTRAKNR